MANFLRNPFRYIKTWFANAQLDQNTLQIAGAVTVGSIGLLFLTRYFAQGRSYTKTNRIDGKVAIVTGANIGLGKETALELAHRGAKVYLACRDQTRGEAARQDIIEQTNNQNVFFRKLDLASFESVREFASTFKAEEDRLDILVNNAGVAGIDKSLTVDGNETVFQVNHLSHFLLTNLLLDLLKKSAPSRIVVVSAMGHRWGEIKKDDVMGIQGEYNKAKAYCISKLANVMFTRHLAKMLDGTGVTVNVLHPGFVETEIFRNTKSWLWVSIKSLIPVFSKSTKNGAQTQIMLALDPDLENVTGKYFDDCKKTEVAENARDDDLAAWLWKKSEDMVAAKTQ